MFQFNENVCPGSKFCISEKHSMTNFIFDEFILYMTNLFCLLNMKNLFCLLFHSFLAV